MFEWLQLLYSLCTSGEPPARWREITFGANLATALAYFWIPGVMAVVFARWREELPYRWLWGGFVIFIAACGFSHVMHAFHALGAQTPHSTIELAILVATAAVSLATAGGFTYVLPRILALSSPAAARNRMEAAVETATGDLQSALEHQRLLLLEVHHRVKNNLQVVASLIGVHMRRSPGGANASLQDLRDRIVAIAAVHGQLQDVGAATLRALPFVKSLAVSLESSKGRPAGMIDVRGEDFDVPLDHAASFALIVHEVLANALEHAFPPGQPGHIDVVLETRGAERTIRVLDAGVGMDPSAKDGIGRTLVKALAVQLGADVAWAQREEGGTSFTVTFEEQLAVSRVPGDRSSSTVAEGV
jgi:two-component sensor histidine kinase